MIKAITADGRLVLLGLSRGNMERLLENKPILVPPAALPGLQTGVLIVGGETEDAITKAYAHVLPRGSLFASKPKPGELVAVGPEGVVRKQAPDPDGVATAYFADRDRQCAAERAASKGFDLEAFEQLAREIGGLIDGVVNAKAGAKGKVGFGLFMFSFGGEGWMTWLSNGDRGDMISALKEFIAKHDAPTPQARG